MTFSLEMYFSTVSVLLMSAFLLSFLSALLTVSMVVGLLPLSSIFIRTFKIKGLSVQGSVILVSVLGEPAITATQVLLVLQLPLGPSAWICWWDKNNRNLWKLSITMNSGSSAHGDYPALLLYL